MKLFCTLDSLEDAIRIQLETWDEVRAFLANGVGKQLRAKAPGAPPAGTLLLSRVVLPDDRDLCLRAEVVRSDTAGFAFSLVPATEAQKEAMDDLVRVLVIDVDHRRAAVHHQRLEQAQLGFQVSLHGRVVIEMVAGEVGEHGHVVMHGIDAALVQRM